jgi:hypothetical protein
VLVVDAFVQLIDSNDVTWQNRSRFYAIAATVMRQMLVDDARQRVATKRGDDPPVPQDAVPQPAGRDSADPLSVLALHEAGGTSPKTDPDRRFVPLRRLGPLASGRHPRRPR